MYRILPAKAARFALSRLPFEDAVHFHLIECYSTVDVKSEPEEAPSATEVTSRIESDDQLPDVRRSPPSRILRKTPEKAMESDGRGAQSPIRVLDTENEKTIDRNRLGNENEPLTATFLSTRRFLRLQKIYIYRNFFIEDLGESSESSII